MSVTFIMIFAVALVIILTAATIVFVGVIRQTRSSDRVIDATEAPLQQEAHTAGEPPNNVRCTHCGSAVSALSAGTCTQCGAPLS